MENQNLKSCIHLFYEVKEDMEKSLETIDLVKNQQEELANIVEKAKNKKNDFKDFIKSCREEIVGYNNQSNVLKEKLDYINGVIEVYEEGHKENATEEQKKTSLLTEQIVTTVCLALGIVQTNTELHIKEEQEANARKEALELENTPEA